MITDLNLYNKLERLPVNLKEEVADFIDFFLEKSSRKTKRNIPKFGSAKGKIRLSDDSDEPLEDFKEYM